MPKTYDEINRKIKEKNCVVVSAEEIIKIAEEQGVKKTAKEVDVVTTATFGTMCSSGIYLNFGHTNPPIKIKKAWLNNIPLYCGYAAVDAFLGATELDEENNLNYGGSHVIYDLIKGKDIHLRAIGYPTDCYPKKKLDAYINKNSINQAVMFNPRNSLQNYVVATNASNKKIYTYMGKLLANFGNATYTSAGELSPLLNDPYYKTIGIGSRIFIGGSQGFIAWEGTQFNAFAQRAKNGVPKTPGGSLGVIGNLKEIDPYFVSPVTIPRYGVSLNVGIGVPIPILNQEILKHTIVTNKEIYTKIYDYSDKSRDKKSIGEVNYEQLRSGLIKIKNKDVPTKPLSNIKKARQIAKILKRWIQKGQFQLQKPIQNFSLETEFKQLELRKVRRGKL
jgi:uncharacterized protein (DUF39 family)